MFKRHDNHIIQVSVWSFKYYWFIDVFSQLPLLNVGKEWEGYDYSFKLCGCFNQIR